MGSAYKLKPETREDIIKTAKLHPKLGSRKLSVLLQEKSNLLISKSSISALLKESGASYPVGRRRIYRKRRALAQTAVPPPPKIAPEKIVSNMGLWLLKAADLSFGGCPAFSEILVKSAAGIEMGEVVPKLEALLYLPWLAASQEALDEQTKKALSSLTGKSFSLEEIKAFVDKTNSNPEQISLISNALHDLDKEALNIKFNLKDKSFFFLDAGFHSIWLNNRIPSDFSQPYQRIKEYIGNIRQAGEPLILQASQGFAFPYGQFFDFIHSFSSDADSKSIELVEIFDTENKLLDSLVPPPSGEQPFIIGLWPWQYAKLRKAQYPQEFAAVNIPHIAENFLFSEGSTTLFSHNQREQVALRSVAIKKDGSEMISLLTNIGKDKLSAEEVLRRYFQRWPYLEAGYQDFLNRQERFNESQPKEGKSSGLAGSTEAKLEDILAVWRQRLERHCLTHYFPNSYEEGPPAILDNFSVLKGCAGVEGGYLKVKLLPPSGKKDLEWLVCACQRANEANIRAGDSKECLFLEVV